jgi:hypothetical protein
MRKRASEKQCKISKKYAKWFQHGNQNRFKIKKHDKKGITKIDAKNVAKKRRFINLRQHRTGSA